MKKYKVINKLKKCNSIALISHISPDADAFGCMVAFRDFLINKFNIQQVDIFNDCINLPESFKLILNNVTINPEIIDYDAVIMMDTPNLPRLGKYEELFNNAKLTFAIDHHATNEKKANYNIVEIVSSTCEIVYKIANEFKYNFNNEMLTNLYAGIVTDTGGFAWGAITKDTFDIASALVGKIDMEYVYTTFLNCYSLLNVQLYSLAINKIDSRLKGNIIFSDINEKELKQYKAKEDDLFMIPNNLNTISSAKFICFMNPCGKNLEVSLRSKKGYNVGSIAKELGGGGHSCASGFVTNKSIDEVKSILYKNFSNQLKNNNSKNISQ